MAPTCSTYGQMMLGYAQVRGLRRCLVPVPVLTPRLSSYWVHWMTPDSGRDRPPAHRGAAQRGDRARRQGAPDVSAHSAVGLPDRGPPRAGQPDGGRGRNDLVGRAGDQPRRRAAGGFRDAGRHEHRAAPRGGGCAARRRVCCLHLTGRCARLAVCRLGLARIRGGGRPAGGRRGSCDADAVTRRGASRRCARFLARRGGRAGPPAAAAGRDEPAGRRLAAIRGAPAARRRDAVGADGFLCPERTAGLPVLVPCYRSHG